MVQKVKFYFFPGLIIFITALISFLNYTPGTFLTGWDTLHPEFNFAQQASNMFFGVFRTDQGLGAVAAHSHMADLPRVILLWLFSFIMPLSFLRYAIIFLSFVLGPLGIYFFIRTILNKNNNLTIQQLNNSSLAAFLAALVYIFNLGTVQQFYVPFEMFVVQYAALGWLFLTALRFIEKPTKWALLLFTTITFLASPMAYASVLWYAYFAFLLLFLLTLVSIERSRKVIVTSLLLIITTILVNAYWILPNLYFLTSSASNVSLAQTNKIFSDEAFLYNKEYGNIFDTAILRNFLFSWTERTGVNSTGDLMTYWKEHLANPLTLSLGYLIFGFVCIGFLIAVVKKNRVGMALIPSFLLSILMVMNMNPPADLLFSYLRDNFGLFREGLRFPFTKFSLLIMFSMSVFFGISIAQILKILAKLQTKYLRVILSIGLVVTVAAGLFWYGFPMFEGKLIDPNMRIKIPSEYFELFDYLKEQPQDARLAPLPLHSLWGWEYYNWPGQGSGSDEGGYQGAGFIWFGIKQPVLARDFDRWNKDNEQYLREMSSAIYSRDARKVETLAKKYRISYFLLDESVIFPGEKQNALWHYETKNTFKKSTNIKLVKKFSHLNLYKVEDPLIGEGFVQKPDSITSVGPEMTGGFVDLAAQNHGDYVVSDSPDFTYFSRSLVNRYDRVDPSNISFLGETIILRLGTNKGYNLTDSWLSNDIFPEFMQTSYDLTIEKQGLPFLVNDEQFISFPAASEPTSVEKILKKSDDCGITTQNSNVNIIWGTDFVEFTAKAGASCGFISFPSAKQDFGSILLLEAKNEKGLPIRLCISESLTNRCDIYTSLDSGNLWKKYAFMISPQPSGAAGYAVHFNTIGIGNDESINQVRFAQFIQIPYYRIANLSFVKDGYAPRPNGISTLEAREINPTLYRADVSFGKNQKGLIALYKGYDVGWRAYELKTQNSKLKTSLVTALPFVFGNEIKDHVEVNNWANGWLLPNETMEQSNNGTIVIVYLPQYLEYAGFALILVGGLGMAASIVIRHSNRVKNTT